MVLSGTGIIDLMTYQASTFSVPHGSFNFKIATNGQYGKFLLSTQKNSHVRKDPVTVPEVAACELTEEVLLGGISHCLLMSENMF